MHTQYLSDSVVKLDEGIATAFGIHSLSTAKVLGTRRPISTSAKHLC